MPVIDVHMISEGFIEAMGLRLVEGRAFTAADRAGAEPVIVISEQFAKQQFPNSSAVNQMLYSRSGDKRVVGVVVDVRPAELGTDPAVAARIASVYAQKYWIAWMGLFKPNPERVRSGKTVIVKVRPPA